MSRAFFNHRWTKLMAGLGTGLLSSTLVTATALYFGGYIERAQTRWLETRLHAAAAERASSMAVATGPIEQGIEGLFVLDFITGDLTCGVMSPRTGQVSGYFRRNVTADLGVEQGKQPKYLMVTGTLDVRGFASNNRPALSLVYVADETTGRYMAYMLPWNTQAISQNQTIVQTMTPIGGGSARNVAVE